MEKTIVATGKSIDAAVEAALAQLGLERDSVSVQVLQQAKPGFLGFGAQPAKVQVTYEAPDEPKVEAPKAPKTGLTKKDAEKAVLALVDTVTEAVVKGDKVMLVGFGSFETKTREARIGRNPKTKEAITIPATRVPVFKAGKALKDAVAE